MGVTMFFVFRAIQEDEIFLTHFFQVFFRLFFIFAQLAQIFFSKIAPLFRIMIKPLSQIVTWRQILPMTVKASFVF